jgi:hypothetical protein
MQAKETQTQSPPIVARTQTPARPLNLHPLPRHHRKTTTCHRWAPLLLKIRKKDSTEN